MKIDELNLIGWYYALIASIKENLENNKPLSKFEKDFLNRLLLNHSEFNQWYGDSYKNISSSDITIDNDMYQKVRQEKLDYYNSF